MAKAKKRKSKINNDIFPRPPLPNNEWNGDAIFTMVLSSSEFIKSNLKKTGVDVDSKALLERITAAVLDTIYPETLDAPVYNVAADALAAAYITFSKGDKSAARKLTELAYQSPDAEVLLGTLMSINEKAVGTKMVADMDDPSETVSDSELEETNSMNQETPDVMEDDYDDDDSSSGEIGYASLKKRIKKRLKNAKKIKVRSGSDDYAIDYGIDGPEGNYDQPDDLGIDVDNAEDLLEVETLGLGDDNVPDTMRLGRISDPNDIVGEYPDNLAKIDMLTASEIKKLTRENPDLISVANKIALMGDAKGVNLAHKFLKRALEKAA